MIEIAKGGPDRGVFQKDIAISQELSLKYLDQIIQSLKTAHLINSARGRKSGYVLTKKPSEITIFDIHRAFEPGICLVECLSGNFQCKLNNQCCAQGFWGQLNNLIIGYFKAVTLEDLMNGRVHVEDLSLIDKPGRNVN